MPAASGGGPSSPPAVFAPITGGATGTPEAVIVSAVNPSPEKAHMFGEFTRADDVLGFPAYERVGILQRGHLRCYDAGGPFYEISEDQREGEGLPC